jgi:hypothetical protein
MNNLKKIIYNDARGYDSEEMRPEDYFSFTKDKNMSLKSSNDNQKETTRELKDNEVSGENNNKIDFKSKENEQVEVRGEIQINNFIAFQSEAHIKDTKKAEIQPVEKIFTFKDYEELEPDQLYYDERTFFQTFKDSIVREHSLLNLLFMKSLLEPAFLRIIKFIYTLSLQFAFSAVLFTDSYIEKRIIAHNKVINNIN